MGGCWGCGEQMLRYYIFEFSIADKIILVKIVPEHDLRKASGHLAQLLD